MTFYEAALEVLRRNERPLHFKKITEISIRDQLLSHIGRDPAKVMVERLQKDIEKGESSVFLEPRRGVFDLKSEVRAKLNLEAQQRRNAYDSRSPGESSHRRRRPSQNREYHSDYAAHSGHGATASTYEPYAFDEETLKNLAKSRFESIDSAAYAILKSSKGNPIHIQQLTEILFDRKLIRFHTHDPITTVKAALVTANHVARRRGKLPPFELYSGNRWALTEWSVSETGFQLHRNLEKLAHDLRKDTEQQLAAALSTLKPEAFEMLVMTLLEFLDYTNVKVSKRTGGGDVLFTSDWTRGFSPARVCIQIVGKEDSIIDENVIEELRSDLPHYSGEEGIIIHLGKVSHGAISASKDPSKTKVTVLDREALVSLLVKHGIGVRAFQQPLYMLDRSFFDTLS